MSHMTAATQVQYDHPGLGPKKSFLVLVIVVGCIAILWPKVFYPMLMRRSPDKPMMNDYRGSGCCDVVLDSDEFANISTPLSTMEHPAKVFRKSINLFTGEISIRQERPLHTRPDAIHPAMRERGRAIPSTQTIPIIEQSSPPSTQPGSASHTIHYVDGRPRFPNLPRPPMGAGSGHKSAPKTGGTMSFIMPMYTIIIVVLFVYTLMRILFKKSNTSPYPVPTKDDPNFTNTVFEQQSYIGYKRPDNGHSSKLVVTTIQGLIDAADEQIKRKENGTTSKNPTDVYQQNGEVKVQASEEDKTSALANGHVHDDDDHGGAKRKKRDLSSERATVKVVGMEMTASCEGGHKWSGRPPTPKFTAHNRPHSPSEDAEEQPEPQSIFLEGALPHDSQILVADSAVTEVETEDEDEAAVVLSSKMTLSLISLDPPESKDDSEDKENQKPQHDEKIDDGAKQEEKE